MSNDNLKIELYFHHAKYYETDQMGVIHHSNYIKWMEEARIDFMEQMNWGYKRMESEGIISPVLAVSCEYKCPVHFDETVSIKVIVKEYTGIKLIITYEMTNLSNGKICTIGESKHCFLNKDGKPISLKREYPEFDKLLSEVIEHQN